MKKKRIIPIVLFRDGHVVQSKFFSEFRNLGNPFDSLRRLSEWGADEVAFLDIGKTSASGGLRVDLGRKPLHDYLDVLESVSTTSSMPLASGGHITTLQDIEDRLLRGADKVVIGSEAFKNANFLTAAIRTFGSQCIVVAVDVRKEKNDYSIYVDNGSKMIGENLANCINKFNELEVGELLLTSINRDGTKIGFDIELIEMVASIARVPLIVCGGAGKWEDFESILRIENVDAVAAANIFQHIDQSVYLAHQYLYTKGLNVRKPQLMR